MHILIINHYAGSPNMGMEFRPYYLAQEWLKAGHQVTIIAATYSHLREQNKTISKPIETETIDGILYVWVRTPKYKGNGFERIKNMFTFVKTVWLKTDYFAKTLNPDIVIASSTYPSDNYIAAKIAEKSNAKHIFEVHDLWPLSPQVLGNMSKYHPLIMLMQHAENFAYKHCDAVVSMLPNTCEHMKQHGLDLTKWHYIPNGIVLDDWIHAQPLPEKLQKICDELKSNNVFIVGYAGGHALSNALEVLIDAAKLLQNYPDIKILLVGDGAEKENLIKKATVLSNVIFDNPIPKLSVPNLLKIFDVAVIGAKKSPLYKYGISPNKLMDYMMAKKPIIQYIETTPDILQTASCGITVEPDNPKALADAILRLKDMTEEQRLKLGENGHQFVLKEHSYSVLSERFLDIMQNLL